MSTKLYPRHKHLPKLEQFKTYFSRSKSKEYWKVGRVVVQLISVISPFLCVAIIGQILEDSRVSFSSANNGNLYPSQRHPVSCIHHGLESCLPRVYPRDFWILASRIRSPRIAYGGGSVPRRLTLDRAGNQPLIHSTLSHPSFYN